MGTFKGLKLNHLVTSWPQNLVATSTWLHSKGVSNDLIKKYVSGGWLTRIGTGAFIRKGDKPDWSSALHAVQSQLNLDVHAGGYTALELEGIYNQVTANSQSRAVSVFGHQGLKLPRWFSHGELLKNVHYYKVDLFKRDPERTFRTSPHASFPVKASTRERAILEVLDVAQPSDYEMIASFFHQLATMRPQVIQSHLELCKSIKAKRLFLVLARDTNMPWFSELKLKRIQLGTGSRLFIKNGSLDSQFKITIPKIERSNVSKE